jgi:hypothetical protein
VYSVVLGVFNPFASFNFTDNYVLTINYIVYIGETSRKKILF